MRSVQFKNRNTNLAAVGSKRASSTQSHRRGNLLETLRPHLSEGATQQRRKRSHSPPTVVSSCRDRVFESVFLQRRISNELFWRGRRWSRFLDVFDGVAQGDLHHVSDNGGEVPLINIRHEAL